MDFVYILTMCDISIAQVTRIGLFNFADKNERILFSTSIGL